jgi:hypothetical protein
MELQICGFLSLTITNQQPKEENWDKYLPQYKKKNIKLKKPQIKKKVYTPFPPEQKPRQVSPHNSLTHLRAPLERPQRPTSNLIFRSIWILPPVFTS